MEERSDPADSRGPIAFDLPGKEGHEGLLAEEREKHRRRAERFGASYVEPGKSVLRPELVLEAKKERLKGSRGFVTGFDPFTEARKGEEKLKRQDRAARFNMDPAPAMEYKPDDEIEARAKRAVKWGVKYEPSEAVLMDMDLFEERREVAREVARRPDAVYLYGVDVMSTKDCLQYFEGFGPTFVEWINDSSCNVLFDDALSAKRAIVGVGHPLPPTESTSAAGLDPTDISNLPYLWHQGQDFIKDGTPVRLIYRMATMQDVKDTSAPRATRELWKLGSQQGGRHAKARRRDNGEAASGPGSAGADQDGDVDMSQGRKNPRGGQRVRRRKMRMDTDGQDEVAVFEDVDMTGCTDDAGDEPAQADVADLREVLHHTAAAEVPVDMGPPPSLLQRPLP